MSSYLKPGSSQSEPVPSQLGSADAPGANQRNPRAVMLPVTKNMQQFQLKLQNRMSLREQLERKRDQKRSTQVVESTDSSTVSSVQAEDQKLLDRAFPQPS